MFFRENPKRPHSIWEKKILSNYLHENKPSLFNLLAHKGVF